VPKHLNNDPVHAIVAIQLANFAFQLLLSDRAIQLYQTRINTDLIGSSEFVFDVDVRIASVPYLNKQATKSLKNN
jgi:hypothetical protein